MYPWQSGEDNGHLADHQRLVETVKEKKNNMKILGRRAGKTLTNTGKLKGKETKRVPKKKKKLCKMDFTKRHREKKGKGKERKEREVKEKKRKLNQNRRWRRPTSQAELDSRSVTRSRLFASGLTNHARPKPYSTSQWAAPHSTPPPPQTDRSLARWVRIEGGKDEPGT